MSAELPRIAQVRVVLPSVLRVVWTTGRSSTVDLANWIDGGGALLSALRRPDTFARARVGDHGASVAWGSDDDLAIDAVHLARLCGLGA